MTVLEIIRLVGTEFAGVGDDTINQWIELTAPLVSERRFGKLYNQALAYLVCHKMKLSGLGENPLGDLGSMNSLGFNVNSVSEGGSSISFGANQSSNLVVDAELGLTAYGVQFLSIRRSVIVPIRISGEAGD